MFIFGWVCFGLGVVGAFLPIIPTTPFILLAAFMFSKSSPRFHQWLMSLPLAGAAVMDWQENRVIRPRAKVLCAAMILFSQFMLWNTLQGLLVVKIMVTVILTSVGIFVVTRKNFSK
jgi:uncharacterized membrane protein YbaN (DUF454 family)